MKKLILYIVLAVFIFNLTGYYLLYEGWKYSIRKEVRAKIRNNGNILCYEILRFSKSDIKSNKILLDWEKDDEFRFGNSMYDVVSKLETADSIIYTCINDHKEKKLIQNFTDFYHNHQHQKATKNNTPLQILEKWIKEFCSVGDIGQFENNGFTIQRTTQICKLQYVITDVPQPPPEFYFL